MYDDGVCERFVSLLAQSKDGMFISPNKIIKNNFYNTAIAQLAGQRPQPRLR
jgi:hypothetical protein